MDKQEVFDKVVAHLLTQNAKSRSYDGGPCMYRGPNGLKCAVGCLIPDDLYHESFDELDADGGIVISKMCKRESFSAVKEFLKIEFTHDIWFLGVLQNIHDNEPVETWPFHLKKFANDNNLTFNQ